MKFWLLAMIGVTLSQALTVEHEKKKKKSAAKKKANQKIHTCSWNWDCNSSETCTTKKVNGRDKSICVK